MGILLPGQKNPVDFVSVAGGSGDTPGRIPGEVGQPKMDFSKARRREIS